MANNKNFKKCIVSILLACSLYSLPIYAKQKPLIIGTLYYDPPYEIPSGHDLFSGFNIQIIHKICTLIHRKCEIKNMTLPQLKKGLANGQVDLMISGTHFIPNHRDNYIKSLPYFMGTAEFITMPKEKLDNLANKKIGVIKQTLIKPTARLDLSYNDPLHVVKDVFLNMHYYTDFGTLMTALKKKEVDAVLLPSGTAAFWNANRNHAFHRVGPRIALKNGMSIVANAHQRALIKKVNKALLTMEKNGAMLAIYKQYWHSIYLPNQSSAHLLTLHPAQHNSFVLPPVE